MRSARWLMVLMMGAGVATRAFADKGMSELTLEPGIAIPIGTTNDYAGNSFELDASFMRNFHEIAAFGWELGYLFSSKFGGTLPAKVVGDIDGDGKADPVSFSSDLSLSILHITPEFKIGPTLDLPMAKINPFFIGGGGLYWTHYPSGTLTTTGTTSSGLALNGTSVAYSGGNDVNGGFNVGGGLSFIFPQNVSIGAEVRYHHIYYGKGINDTSYLVPALRLTLLF